VCASRDGSKTFQTHGNACAAKCVGAVVAAQGECAAVSGGGGSSSSAPGGGSGGGAAPASAPALQQRQRQQQQQQGAPAPEETPGSGAWRGEKRRCRGPAKGAAVGPLPARARVTPAPPTPLVLPAVASALPASCPCPAGGAPVCGTVSAAGRRETFPSACHARCKAARRVRPGACPAGADAAAGPAADPAAGGSEPVPQGEWKGERQGLAGPRVSGLWVAACLGRIVAAAAQCAQPPTRAGLTPPVPRPSWPAGKECRCPLWYIPVCGSDGTTCERRRGTGASGHGCSNAAPAARTRPRRPRSLRAPLNPARSAVPPLPPCPRPRPSLDANECTAKCNGVRVAYEGECQRPSPGPLPSNHSTPNGGASDRAGAACGCRKDDLPLCGLNGATYRNPCAAKCANATQAYPGPCIPGARARRQGRGGG
jgi:hypothetical protein